MEGEGGKEAAQLVVVTMVKVNGVVGGLEEETLAGSWEVGSVEGTEVVRAVEMEAPVAAWMVDVTGAETEDKVGESAVPGIVEVGKMVEASWVLEVVVAMVLEKEVD